MHIPHDNKSSLIESTSESVFRFSVSCDSEAIKAFYNLNSNNWLLYHVKKCKIASFDEMTIFIQIWWSVSLYQFRNEVSLGGLRPRNDSRWVCINCCPIFMVQFLCLSATTSCCPIVSYCSDNTIWYNAQLCEAAPAATIYHRLHFWDICDRSSMNLFQTTRTVDSDLGLVIVQYYIPVVWELN